MLFNEGIIELKTHCAVSVNCVLIFSVALGGVIFKYIEFSLNWFG